MPSWHGSQLKGKTQEQLYVLPLPPRRQTAFPL
jgi:hypothetical protein